MKTLTTFEKFILAQPVPSLSLPALPDDSAVDLCERGFLLGYATPACPRGEDHLRRLAIVCGILPGSVEEVQELELAGY